MFAVIALRDALWLLAAGCAGLSRARPASAMIATLMTKPEYQSRLAAAERELQTAFPQ